MGSGSCIFVSAVTKCHLITDATHAHDRHTEKKETLSAHVMSPCDTVNERGTNAGDKLQLLQVQAGVAV